MKAAGFVVHPARETAMAAAKRLSQWFDDRDVEVRWFDPANGDDRMAAEFGGGLAQTPDLDGAIGEGRRIGGGS